MLCEAICLPMRSWLRTATSEAIAPAGGAPPRIAFVATNSVTQGEQVAQTLAAATGPSPARYRLRASDLRVRIGRTRQGARPAWSSSGWTRPATPRPTGDCSPTRTSTGRRSKASTLIHAVLTPYRLASESASCRPRGRQSRERDAPTDHRLQAHRRWALHLPARGAVHLSGGRAGGGRRFCGPSSALASTSTVGSAGFSRCITPLRPCWRGCRMSENASPPFAPTERPARVGQLSNSPYRLPRSDIQTSRQRLPGGFPRAT